MDSSALVSVIIPCYRRHMSFLEEQLGSWVRYASDAARLPFLVIVSPGERNRFVQRLRPLSRQLQLRVHDITTAVERASEALPMRSASDRRRFFRRGLKLRGLTAP